MRKHTRRETPRDATIDEWFQQQDKAADQAFKKLKAKRQEKGVFIEIYTEPRKASKAPRPSVSLLDRFIEIWDKGSKLRTSLQNMIEALIQEFEKGTLNTAGHDVKILKRESGLGFFKVLVIDGVVQGETLVRAASIELP